MERENDVQLIHAILSGDDEAFSTLVQKHKKGVHALVWRKLGDFHYAEEVTQDTFLRAYENLSTLKDPNQFAGWLYVIANRLCMNWMRKKKPAIQSLADTSVEEIEKSVYGRYLSEQRETEASERRYKIVQDLLEKLPESERTVVTLHYLGEMKVKEIGKFLGVSMNTIKSRLHRARKRLQDEQELLVQEVLGGVQLPANFVDNIMERVVDLTPTPPAAGKPLLPWAAFGAMTILVVLLLGASNQYLARFQKPYSFEAESEPTIEIVDAPIILDIAAKPAVRNQVGRAAIPGKSSRTGAQVSDTTSASVTLKDSAKFSTAQWTEGNTPPGGLAHDIFAASDGTVYAVTPTGMYRFATDATAWTRINTSVPINRSPMPMAEHGGTLYIVSADETFTSDDSGESWNTLGPRPKGHPVGLIITDDAEKHSSQTRTTMYLALRHEGIFRSTDGGTQWSSLNEGLTGEIISAIDTVEKTVFIGTASGLYRLDSGIWQQLPLETSGAVCSLAVSGNNLYVGTGSDLLVRLSPPMEVDRAGRSNSPDLVRIFHSADLGASWTEITPEYKYSYTGPPAGITVLTAGEALLALGYLEYRSTDEGKTWTKLGVDPDFLTISSLPSVAVNETTFYKTGIFGIHQTTDGGESWQLFMDGMRGTRLADLVAFNNRLYAYTGYKVYQSADGGVSWKNVQIDTEESALKSGTDPSFDSKWMIADNTLYFVSATSSRSGRSLRIFRLSTDDDTLIPVQGIPTFDDEATSSELWIGSEKAEETHLSNSSKKDFGSTVKLPYAESIPKTKMIVVSNDVFYVEYKRRLFKWRPGDPGWTITGLVDTSQPFDEDYRNGFKLAASAETVYVGKREGKLFQSLDAGNSWRDITPNLPLHFTRFKEIAFVGSNVYVATDKGVLRSQTGEHWRVLTDSAGKRTIIDRFAVGGTKVYGVGDTGTYLLDTHGRWEQISSEVLDEVISLAVINDKLYSATEERGIYYISLEEE